MPSRSYRDWLATGIIAMDQIAAAHAAVGGTAPGRRSATEHINQAYVMVIASQFQRFCRDLHSESADHLASSISNPLLQSIVRDQLTWNRKLDHGNANPGNLGSDYGRFGIRLWPVLDQQPRNRIRKHALETLNTWRNAIAHQDFSVFAGAPTLRLQVVRQFRAACEGLAVELDGALGQYLTTIMGIRPW